MLARIDFQRYIFKFLIVKLYFDDIEYNFISVLGFEKKMDTEFYGIHFIQK